MADSAENLKQIACDTIDAQTPQLKALSQDIWNHPELCFQETYAHQTITDFLEQQGFNVERSYKIPTAFKAVPKNIDNNKGTNIAVLCEYDALPEIGHACGHNLIAIIGVATSLGIQAALNANPKMRETGRVRVKMIFFYKYQMIIPKILIV